MAETKTDQKAGAADVVLTLEDREMPLADLVAATSQTAVASAWARGDVEFGRRVRVVTGNPQIRSGPMGTPGVLSRPDESPAGLVVEDGFEWSGPKTAQKAPLASILADNELPHCPRYRKYVPATNDRGEEYLKPVNIPRAEAQELCAYRVRLTDKGLASLQAV